MRSRYSAFSVGDSDYLRRTWHPATRPAGTGVDRRTRWTGLEVLETARGGPFDTEGTVRFRAHYVERGRRGRMEENSKFVRVEGDWVYVGTV